MKEGKMDRKAYEEEKKSREIKRVREGEILDAALRTGRNLSEVAQEELIRTLLAAIEQHGIQGAVAYCHTQATPLMDSLSQANKAKVSRVSEKNRNPENKPDKLEKELLDAYAYSLEEGQDIGDNIQLLDNGDILYTKPIIIKNGLCLNCHGTAETMDEEVVTKIEGLYPRDQATGYTVGQLRGMWSITLNKKEVIKNL